MALTVKARTEIKCRFWGVDEHGHDQGAQQVLSHKGTAYSETEEEMLFRYYMAMVLISYPLDEWEEILEEIFGEMFPE